jgi:hypothetical protein
MRFPDDRVLVATICNTIYDASAYALWFSDGARQCVLDLSVHISNGSGLTGIAYHRNRIYVAVQGIPARILVLDTALNVIDTIMDDHFNDLHSLQIVGENLVIVSPRNGKLLKHDLLTGRTTQIANFDSEAWVSVVHFRPDDIWLCGHHLRYLDPTAEGGGIFSLTKGRKVLDGLIRPHSLMGYHDEFLVLDSGNGRVVYFDQDGIINHTCQLHGFLRGATIAGDSLFVAGGPHRTISRKNPAGAASRSLRDVAHERLKVFELDQGELSQTHLPELPGFEVYDLLLLPSGVKLEPDPDRIVEVEHGTFGRFYYVTLVDALYRLSTANAPPANK